MRSRALFVAVALAASALLGVLIVTPQAWAISAQARLGQTIPTRTPTRPYAPTATRVVASPTPVPPAPTETPPPATGEPTPPAPATAGPGAQAVLRLVKEVGRVEAWPGATLVYTLTLSNLGTVSARQVVLEDVLPAGLSRTGLPAGEATWDGRTLRARLPVLPPGGAATFVYSAVVGRDAAYGAVLVNRAVASAAGGLVAEAGAYVALPPAELPPVGADSVLRPR